MKMFLRTKHANEKVGGVFVICFQCPLTELTRSWSFVPAFFSLVLGARIETLRTAPGPATPHYTHGTGIPNDGVENAVVTSSRNVDDVFRHGFRVM
jgi:hypothetical protein